MKSLSVKVPFAGEAVSVFKSACDFVIHSESAEQKLTKVTDEDYKFSESITLGVFRLLLDGNLTLVDKDLENLVSLMTLTSKDRGGKGKLDAKFKLFIAEDSDEIVCEAEVEAKGMLARVELPIEIVLSEKLTELMQLAVASAEETVVTEVEIRDLIQEDQVEEASKPLWVFILQLPAALLSLPLNLFRKLAFAF